MAAPTHDEGPTIGEAAEYLNIRHHSTVELVDRVERAGLDDGLPDGPSPRSGAMLVVTGGTIGGAAATAPTQPGSASGHHVATRPPRR